MAAITIKQTRFQQSFNTKVAGVSHDNPDGTNRQKIIERCRIGETVFLKREPQNKHDKHAILVTNTNSIPIGYLPSGDSRLAHHIDSGGHTEATIIKITGGKNLVQKIFRLKGKHYGLVIKIVKIDPDWNALKPYMDENKAIETLIEAAKKLEETNPIEAISKYQEATSRIKALDNLGLPASAWRTVRHPVERISLLLEQQKQKQEALNAILCWRSLNDPRGLPSATKKILDSRQARLEKSLSK